MVAVITGTFSSTGFIITIEYDVHINDNIANIIPVIFVLDCDLSFSKGNIRNERPDRIPKIPIHENIEGISFRKINPKIPENISGPTNNINDNINGDNLFNDAKNKLSPIAIPNIPLIATGTKFSIPISIFVPVKYIIINNINEANNALNAVIAIGSNFSPSFFSNTVHTAHDIVDINAIMIPNIELFILISYP